MTWTRLSDDFADHPKIEPLSNDALALYIVALVDSNRRGTDGVISGARLEVLQVQRHVSNGAIKELLDVGLWEKNGDGVAVHDFLQYNPSAKEEKRRKAVHAAEMKKRRKAGKRGG